MENNPNHELKTFATDALVKSKDEVSEDREIIEKIKDKIIIIRETKQVEVTYNDDRPLVKIPLYLIGKFIGHKVLNMFDDASAPVEEISARLNMSNQALSRPLGMLANDIIEKTDRGYKIRAFRILPFLESLNNSAESNTPKASKSRKSTNSVKKIAKEEPELKLKNDGISSLAEFLEITEDALRKLMFFRENDLRIIDPKFIDSTDTKEIQLDYSLAYLIALKHCFDVEKCHSTFLRNKLTLLGIQSLTNLTTHLHKYPQYIIHDAGKKGSTENYFLITLPGENRIKEKIRKYVGVKND